MLDGFQCYTGCRGTLLLQRLADHDLLGDCCAQTGWAYYWLPDGYAHHDCGVAGSGAAGGGRRQVRGREARGLLVSLKGAWTPLDRGRSGGRDEQAG